MASLAFRRALGCALPSLFAAFFALHPGGQARSPNVMPNVIKVGTDVFGSGTGGLSDHATAVWASPYDKSGWGITTMKTYTPPAPEPYKSPKLPAVGAHGYDGAYSTNVMSDTIEGDAFGGALEPLDQR